MEDWVNPQPGWVRSGYWTRDLSHDGPMLHQLSYPSRIKREDQSRKNPTYRVLFDLHPLISSNQSFIVILQVGYSRKG